MIYITGSTPASGIRQRRKRSPLLVSFAAVWQTASGEINTQTIFPWAYTNALDISNELFWVEATNLDSFGRVVWNKAKACDNDLMITWLKSFQADNDLDILWRSTSEADHNLKLLWAETEKLDKAAELIWQKAGSVDRSDLVPWGKMSVADIAANVVWEKTKPADINTEIPWVKTKALDVHHYSPWVHGKDDIPKYQIKTDIKLPWLAVARLIMTKQNIVFKRVADDEPIRILSGSFGIDDDSWCYSFNAVLPSREDLEKVMPDALGAGEIEVELSVNGYTGRFLVNSYQENQAIGKGTYSIAGKSISAVLGAPYCPRKTKTYTATNARQIVATELSAVGWNLDWQLLGNTWNIDGEFSVVDKTIIEIISEIAKAVGGIVQCDQAQKTLILKSRFPVSPKNYPTATPEEYIVSGVLGLSGNYQAAPLYNQVIVSGKETGVVATVRRSGTTGNQPAPEIIDPLLTNQAVSIERGRVELDQTGYNRTDYNLTLPLPESGSGQRPKLLFPCDIVEVTDKNETWRGRISQVSIGFQPAKTRQQITVERYNV